MMDWLFPFNHWHWWVIALILVGVELTAPGVFLVWFGLGAAVTGAALYFAPELGWKTQVVTFSCASAVSIGAVLAYRKHRPVETDEPHLNRRGERYIGRTAVVAEDIKGGVGTVRIEDTQWRAEGPDVPAGTTVRIVDVKGTTVIVERI